MAAGDHSDRGLPPSQRPSRGWPVVHTARSRDCDPGPGTCGCSERPPPVGRTLLDAEAFAALPHTTSSSDLHCVTKWTLRDVEWAGVAAAELLRVAPPADDVKHVMVWAEYGYSANLPLTAFAAPDTLLATHADGEPLSRDHGFPLRLVCPSLYAWKSAKWVRAVEYLVEDRRGFWEERGYHNRADPWQDERYAYQE